MRITIIAVGLLKTGPELELFEKYKKRTEGIIKSSVSLFQLKPSSPKQEANLILKYIPSRSYVIVLDERGSLLNSKEFSSLIDKEQHHYHSFVFILGGPNGLDQLIREKSHEILSFGRLTWPHLLARTMLMEQIYRAISLLKNHPYHRE